MIMQQMKNITTNISLISPNENQPKILDNKDKLFENLIMLFTLEEEKDSKTNNVTEELVLYMFLGVLLYLL